MKVHKRIWSLLLAFVLVLSVPGISKANIGIETNVKAYYVGEQESGRVLLDHNGDEVLPIASLTKIMTYIVVKDAIAAGTVSPTDSVKITEAIEAVPGSGMDLKEGEELTVNDLLTGMIVVSANDAATALAIHTAGSEHNFVGLMDRKAEELGLRGYGFYTASGYPYGGQDNKLSAKDVFKMVKYCLDEYPEILELSTMRVLDMPERNYREESTVPLVGEMKGVDGLKTGTTDAAGHCLVSTFSVPDEDGHEAFRAISVVLGTESKDMRSRVGRYIIEYVQNNFRYREILDPTEPYRKIRVNSVEEGEITLYPEEELVLLVNKEQGITKRDYIKKTPQGPIRAGEVLGEIIVEPKGQPLRQINLVTRQEYKQAETSVRIQRTASYIFRLMRQMLYI